MLLQVKELNYSYKDGDSKRDIFINCNIEFETGYFYSLLGDSGSGKTTFLSIIGGQDKSYEGKVICDDKEIKEIGLDKYRRSKVSMIYQNYNLIPYLNAIENIMIAMDISENVKTIDKQEIYHLLESIGINQKKANRKASSLSGGEQQRVAIARAIETNCPIIVADEPTGNLDYKNSEDIIQLFKQLAHKYNRCIIMVTHNEKLAQESDVIYRIDEVNKKIVLESRQGQDFEFLNY